jgi:hypothetical protein
MEIKQTLRRQPVHATGPLFFHRLEGQDPEDMLIPGYKEWEKWLGEQKGDSTFHLMEDGMWYPRR